MLDILRRISDGEGLEDAQEGDEDDSEAQGAELAKILEGVDLGQCSSLLRVAR